MQVLEWMNNLLLAVTDPILGWILWLPRDARFFIVAVATSLILVMVRKWTTNQDWLKRADADQKRLGEMIRAAKKAGDKEAAARYKQTIATIKMRATKYEGRPLLWSLLPIILLATWCFGRLGFVPPEAGKEVGIKAVFSNSAVGRVVHAIPCEGLAAVGGWVRVVAPDSVPEPAGWWQKANAWIASKMAPPPEPAGTAVWTLRADTRKTPYTLRVAFDGKVRELQLLVGSRKYSAPMQLFPNEGLQSLEVQLKPLMLFGVVPGIDCIMFPPWLVAYLLIAVPFVFLLRRVLAVY